MALWSPTRIVVPSSASPHRKRRENVLISREQRWLTRGIFALPRARTPAVDSGTSAPS